MHGPAAEVRHGHDPIPQDEKIEPEWLPLTSRLVTLMNDVSVDPIDSLRRIAASLHRLAWPAAEQIARLEDRQLPVDELALDLEWSISTLWAATEANLVAPSLKAQIFQIDRLLDDVSGAENAMIWTSDALRNHAVWVNVRRMARRALAELAAIPGLDMSTLDND